MKRQKKFSPFWIIPAMVIVALILWCIYFPLSMFMGLDKNVDIQLATVAVHEDVAVSAGTYSTEDPEQLAQFEELLRSTRCRFFGLQNSTYYVVSPMIDVVINGERDGEWFSLHLVADDRGNIVLQRNFLFNIKCRAKDGELYDYLMELAESIEENTPVVGDGWNYTPSKDPVLSVESAIFGESAKGYCTSVSVFAIFPAPKQTAYYVEQYRDFQEGWTEDYLREHMRAVHAAYNTVYDGTKTPLQSSDLERTFILLRNDETGLWEIFDSTAGAPGETRAVAVAAESYLYRLMQTTLFYEEGDIDLTDGTVLTVEGYEKEKAAMQPVAQSADYIKVRRAKEPFKSMDMSLLTAFTTDYVIQEGNISYDRADVNLTEVLLYTCDGVPSVTYDEFTLELVKYHDTWLVAGIENSTLDSVSEVSRG